jgi:hypothetical protein
MTKEKKTADPKKYMREYMAKRYAENPDEIQTRNKHNYYKRTFDITDEDITTFGEHTAEAGKALFLLRELYRADKNVFDYVIKRCEV